jgi:fibronectin type 3 domain-containing protein
MKKFCCVISVLILAFLAGCGGGSKQTTTTTTQVTVPGSPTGLAATVGDSQVSLSWNAVSGASSYNVYYSAATGVTPANGTKMTASSASATVTGLTNGTAYYFIVTAVNSAGESVAAAQVSATPVPAIPTAPTGLNAVAGNAQVALTWTAVSGATSYNVYYSTSTGVTIANGTKVVGISSTATTISSLTNGTPYFFIVTAVNAGGESAASSQATATPVAPALPPVAPTGLHVTVGDSQVSLTWTASSGATTYNIYYGTTTPLTIANATKISGTNGTSANVTGLANGTVYYFAITAVGTGGESAFSAEINGTPTNGIIIPLTPGAAASGTLPLSSTSSLTYSFAAGTVNQDATVTVTPILKANLPVPLARQTRTNGRVAPMVSANDTFMAAFGLSVDPTSIAVFNVPVAVSGTVDATFAPGSTINLAILENNQWVDIATFIVGSNLNLTENLVSVTLPGLVQPGTFLLYQPAKGTNTSVSNLGVVLLADDGYDMSDGSDGLQVIHLYDVTGNLLTTPVITLLDYANAGDLDGEALTPDGSQGIMVDGGNNLLFFSAVQTGVPLASPTALDVSTYGGDGDSIAIMPNGDEAVATLDDNSQLELVSGIVSGNPVVAEVIPVPSDRDGVVLSNDGQVLLARMGTQITVFSVAPITPRAGIAGTISHSFTQITDLTSTLTASGEDGRDGMAISPVDSSRAVVVGSSGIQMLTGLPSTPVLGTPLDLSALNLEPLAVSVTPDGKFAVVGGVGGLLLFSGVDTGTLTQIGGLYAPTYASSSGSVTLMYVTTLGITLDGKYVAAGDRFNNSLLVIPYNSAGFAASPSTVISPLAIPDNDQLLIH